MGGEVRNVVSSFTAPLDLRSLPDGHIGLLRPLDWYTTHKPPRLVTIPLGFVCDGASIPKPLWPIIGHPLSSTVIRAAALHDWLYHCHRIGATPIRRVDADSEFREALAVDGVGWVRRWVMFVAVRATGRWSWRRTRSGRIVDHDIVAEVWRIRQTIDDAQ